MPATFHPSTQQNPECTSGSSSPALHQAIFSTDSTRRLVVGYVSFGSRLVVGWWSVTCRLVVDWWSVMCRFSPATFGLTPCQSSPPSQNSLRNSITAHKTHPNRRPSHRCQQRRAPARPHAKSEVHFRAAWPSRPRPQAQNKTNPNQSHHTSQLSARLSASTVKFLSSSAPSVSPWRHLAGEGVGQHCRAGRSI